MVRNINISAGNYCEMMNDKMLPIAKRRKEKLQRFLKLK
jgi:two-component system LytT family response regulator